MRKNRSAFTLVELLVVIGIIALLIGILLPSLSRARQQGLLVKCAANQHSILQAMILHANDHKGFFPICGRVYALNGLGATPEGLADSARQRYEYFDDLGPKTRPMPMPAAMAKYMGQDVRTDSWVHMIQDCNSGLVGKAFLCPADQDHGHPATLIECLSPAWQHLPPQPLNITSYAFNEAALGFAEPGNGPPINHSRARGNTAQMPHPGTLMILTDAKPRGGDVSTTPYQLYYENDPDCTLADVYNNTGDGFTKAAAGSQPGPYADGTGKSCGSGGLFDKNRHPGGRMNIGFADGHVENVQIDPGILSQVSLCQDFGRN